MKSLEKGLIATCAGAVMVTGIVTLRSVQPAPTRTAILHVVDGRPRDSTAPVQARSPASKSQHLDTSAELVRDIDAALVSVDDRERERALDESLPRLMSIDPSAAALILQRAPSGFGRDELRDRIARSWASANMDAALDWLTTLDDADDRRLATASIRAQVAASDPGTAIEISDLMDVGRDDGTLAHMAQIWAEENPSAAIAWAERQPAGPSRDALLARIKLVAERTARSSTPTEP